MGNQQGKERRDYGRKIDWKNAGPPGDPPSLPPEDARRFVSIVDPFPERPSPPGKPFLVPEEGDRLTDVITIRWSPPANDGGAPIVGYVVEHRRTGSPHWLRATPDLVLGTELPLTGLEPGWRYQFRVSAENDVGRSDPGDLSEPLTVTPQKWAASAPFFNTELSDTIGLENEKVEFKVQVVAIPPPTIAWYKDGFEVFSSRRTKIVTENDQSTFIIHQAALEDEGEIKCTATNRAGHAVTRATLKLEAPPRIRLPRQYEDGLIFEKGELIRLKVTTAGRPPPEVSWYHDGELLQKGGRFEVVSSETGSTVRISDACRHDRGEYVIKGVNKIGEDVASFLVTVTDRPSPPGKVQLTAIGRRVTLSWSSPEDDGGCKIGSYIVEYFRMGWDMWLKAKNSRQLSTTLDDLIEGSEYKFRVRAENPYGVSEPGEESDVIFIPDPKRGVFKPLPRTESADLSKDSESNKREESREKEETEEAKRRRLLEDKARKLLDTPLSVLLPYENNDKRKRSLDSMDEESLPPPVPKRKNKGKGRLTPSPVNVSPSDPQKTFETESKSVKRTEELTNGAPEDSLKFQKEYTFDRESPMYPRENDDSILHGSSELMLVIYPRERSKSVELSAQQRSEIETNLTGEGVAPPMSLSAPELGSSEIYQQPPMRDAISSSELLYERTMARLYQDRIEEESQRTVRRRYSTDRKSVERRASLKETLERRLSFKGNHPEETSSSNKPEETQAKPSGKDARERLNSVERERLEFAMVRERLKMKEEERKARAGTNECETSTTTATSSSVETEDLEEEYEDDEYLEEEEEDYLDLKKGEKEEETDEDFIDDTMIKEDHSRIPKPVRIAPHAEQEEDTYHPRSMIPTRSVFSKVEKPEEVKTAAHPPLTPAGVTTPPSTPDQEKIPTASKIPVSRHKKASKLLKKFGLKKDRKVPEVTLTPADPNAVVPKPILKNKTPSRKKDSPRSLLKFGLNKPAEKSVSEEESENEIAGRKKKQVRIAEPKEEVAEKAKQKPVDENARENQVLIFHYSDIVKEFGGNKRPPAKLYLNYDELKAHAKPEESEKINPPLEPPRERNSPTVNLPPEDATPTPKPETPQPEVRIRSSLEYLTDVLMFIIACWLYLFKNELYAIPVLCVMAYRQLKDITLEKYEKLRNLKWKLIPDVFKRKTVGHDDE